MLLTSQLKIQINHRTKLYYSLLGYNTDKTEITINVQDLPKCSGRIVECKCDSCNIELKMSFQAFNKRMEASKMLLCKKCSFSQRENPFTNPEIKEKIKNVLIKKYGVDSPLKSKEIRDKKDQTMIEKYGHAYSFDNHEIEEKRNNTIKNRTIEDKNRIFSKISSKVDYKKMRLNFESKMLERYGVINALENAEIKLKMIETNKNKTIEEKKVIRDSIIKTNINKYGVKYPITLDLIKEKSKKTKRVNSIISFIKKYKDLQIKDINYDTSIVTGICPEHGEFEIGLSAFYHRLKSKTDLCVKCNILGTYTNEEDNIINFIKSYYSGIIEIHKRKILNNEFEIDIYLPDIKVGFEYNGLYWHSEIYKDKDYHLKKTEFSQAEGIKLIHIYEDDWLYKQDIVKSRIVNILNKSEFIYARKCQIKEITNNSLSRDFLNKNHLQGNIGSKIKIGLFYNDELVSLMTFGSLRKPLNQKQETGTYEMLRYCNKLNATIVGGASKLVHYFIRKYNPKNIISYADRSWSDGNLYEKLGFTLSHQTKPNYFYIINRRREYRFNFRKDILVREGFDENKSEHEIMLERKIFRIYDSGHLKYILNI